MPPERAAFAACAVARGLLALPHAMAALLGPPGSPPSPWFGVLLGGRCGRAAASAAALGRIPKANPVPAHAAGAAAPDGDTGRQAGSAGVVGPDHGSSGWARQRPDCTGTRR